MDDLTDREALRTVDFPMSDTNVDRIFNIILKESIHPFTGFARTRSIVYPTLKDLFASADIDELTMNAIKHAFPDKSKPNKKITKKITKIDNENAELVLQDNGVGINDPDKITKNLGCEIIKNLTKQLDGHIELFEHEHGTGYRLILWIF